MFNGKICVFYCGVANGTRFTNIASDGLAEIARLEIAGLENDGLEFGALRNEGLTIFQYCKCQVTRY